MVLDDILAVAEAQEATSKDKLSAVGVAPTPWYGEPAWEVLGPQRPLC